MKHHVVSWVWSWPITILAFLWVTSLGPAGDWIGRLEGNYFPVTKNVELFRLGDSENLSTYTGTVGSIISGSFDKTRNCTGIDVKWNVIAGDRMAPAESRLIEEFGPLPKGSHLFGPWEVEASADQFELGLVYADVYHRCHPLWPTITRFYP